MEPRSHDEEQVWGDFVRIPASPNQTDSPIRPLAFVRWPQCCWCVATLVARTTSKVLPTTLRVYYSLGAGRSSVEFSQEYLLQPGFWLVVPAQRLQFAAREIRLRAQALAGGSGAEVFGSVAAVERYAT